MRVAHVTFDLGPWRQSGDRVDDDHVERTGVRFAANMFFYVLGFMLFVLGTIIVVTFDPSKWPGTV